MSSRNTTCLTRQSFQGWFFYAHSWDFRNYLRLLKIKVSSTTMNVPNAIRSLKSRFIRTTSHLCMMEGQHPCNTIVPCHNGSTSVLSLQYDFFNVHLSPAPVRSLRSEIATLDVTNNYIRMSLSWTSEFVRSSLSLSPFTSYTTTVKSPNLPF